MAEEKKLTAAQKNYVERAQKADIALGKIQKLFKVKLMPRAKLDYAKSGIGIVADVTWVDTKGRKN